jgi:hypothetical protein
MRPSCLRPIFRSSEVCPAGQAIGSRWIASDDTGLSASLASWILVFVESVRGLTCREASLSSCHARSLSPRYVPVWARSMNAKVRSLQYLASM